MAKVGKCAGCEGLKRQAGQGADWRGGGSLESAGVCWLASVNSNMSPEKRKPGGHVNGDILG